MKRLELYEYFLQDTAYLFPIKKTAQQSIRAESDLSDYLMN